MLTTGSVQEESLQALLAGLEGQSKALRASLNSGGLGAAALAETFFRTAGTLDSGVTWEEPLDELGQGAVRDENMLTLVLSNHTVTLTEEPRSVSMSKREPEPEALSLIWNSNGSIAVECIEGMDDESWVVMADGRCLDGSELDELLEERTDALEEQEEPIYDRTATTTPSGTGFEGWLKDFGWDDLVLP